jgi:predicted dinucleotide-binding enzyme
MNVTIIGAGNMGRGIATRALAGGHPVRIIDHHTEKASALAADLGVSATDAAAAIPSADLVVIAVKYPATLDVARAHASELAGKVVIDIANPADFTTFDPATDPGTSAAEELAAAIPRARVVKAFNTTFAAPLETGQVDGRPLDVLIAGDDAGAKQATTEFVESAGMHPIDVGPLRRARALESFQIVHMSLQQGMRNPWDSAIAILTESQVTA